MVVVVIVVEEEDVEEATTAASRARFVAPATVFGLAVLSVYTIVKKGNKKIQY